MGSVTFAKQVAIPFQFGGCGIQGITCMGNGRMLAILEEVGGPDGVYPQRVFRSADDGVTWTELAPFMSTHNLWFWAAYATGLDTVLVGNQGPDLGDPQQPDDAIARTTDGGDTWGKAISDTLFDPAGGDFWSIQWFTRLSPTTILASGSFEIGGTRYHTLISTDNGASFTTPRTVTAAPPATVSGMEGGAAIDDQRIVLAAHGFLLPASVFRSTDGGASFSQILLPNTQHQSLDGTGSSLSVVHMQGGIMLACGSVREFANSFPPKLWRSTDFGQTWTEITDSLPGWTPLQQTPCGLLLRLDANRAVLAIHGAPDNLGGSNWRLTEDAGVTWATQPAGPYTLPTSRFVFVRALGVADDGAVLVTLTTSGAPFDNEEIWRGVPAGFSAPGPCADMQVRAAIAGRPLDCGSAFPPNPCPQEC